MMFHDLAEENRSVRRFRESDRITDGQLFDFIDAARLAPCGANLQLLRFTPVTKREYCSRIFPAIGWAAYLDDWNGPAEGERPAAYIVIHAPTAQRAHIPIDAGIAAAYIVLAARESGFASCMILSFSRDMILEAIGTPEGCNPYLVIALGVPLEETVLEKADGSIRYYRDEEGRHHVPKLALEDIIVQVKD